MCFSDFEQKKQKSELGNGAGSEGTSRVKAIQKHPSLNVTVVMN